MKVKLLDRRLKSPKTKKYTCATEHFRVVWLWCCCFSSSISGRSVAIFLFQSHVSRKISLFSKKKNLLESKCCVQINQILRTALVRLDRDVLRGGPVPDLGARQDPDPVLCPLPQLVQDELVGLVVVVLVLFSSGHLDHGRVRVRPGGGDVEDLVVGDPPVPLLLRRRKPLHPQGGGGVREGAHGRGRGAGDCWIPQTKR